MIPTKTLFPALLSLLITLGVIMLEQWRATDLIWGLWICSLSIGYLDILLILFRRSQAPPLPKRLSTLVFFTFHFGFFHFVHAQFLAQFFPLPELAVGASEDPRHLLSVTLGLYWPLILTSLISQYPQLRQPISQPKQAMTRPYQNVIRMHLLILLFAALEQFDLAHWALYPIIAVYFVPWHAFRSSAPRAATGQQSISNRGNAALRQNGAKPQARGRTNK
ncbi:DUF6498-containing protein [Ferrimonas pelagia]|uniref:Uncharacterized protein n=1 Tax=Ferrimonas pelagia TaxID=1177826 RepID=A0ABP9FHS3_9GAMM